MNFIDELKWRGMLHDLTPGAEEYLNENQVVGYIGFDPTAPSMTIGNYVQIQLLKLFQLCGHKPIVLMGGATGRIGDPSGKDKERELKTEDELDSNLQFQLLQVKKFLDFNGDNPAVIVNNYDFYKDMKVLDFLREVGKTLTVSYMMSKDSVKNRLETGLSFTEFSYQLLQAYDYLCLYKDFDCKVQMGGSDQWGNITSGTEFIRRHVEGKAYAITTPLLTKADGKKFGKSEEGNIWLDPKKTSPYKFYQFWLNADDADIEKFTKYFTLKSKEVALAELEQYKDDPRTLKKMLAEELTARVHCEENLKSVQEVTELMFGKTYDTSESLASLSIDQFEILKEELPSFDIQESDVVNGLNILDLLSDKTTICSSKGEARKAMQNNAISINKTKISSIEHNIQNAHFIYGKYLLAENGKKNKYLISVSS
jgi:tyrosyl-tRNA synthetase